MNPLAALECLERRVLMAHIGSDLYFGQLGFAPADADLLIAPQPGGAILVVGNEFVQGELHSRAVRLNGDGSVDAAFVAAPAPQDELNAQQALVIDDRLIIAAVGGEAGGEKSLLVRALNLPGGSADDTYGDGDDGVARIAVEAPDPTAGGVINLNVTDALATPDGGLLLAVTMAIGDPGTSTEGADVIYKLDSGGALDTSFGDGGVVVINELGSELFPTLLPARGDAEDGAFIALVHEPAHAASLIRYNADGTIDTTFGDQGRARINGANLPVSMLFPNFGEAAVQSDGKIVMAVTDSQDFASFGFLIRVNADGTVDDTFGDGGAARFGSDSVIELVTDAQDRVTGATSDRQLFRVTADGTFDPTFDDDGTASGRPGPGKPAVGFPATMAVDAGGSIFVGYQDQAGAGGNLISKFIDHLRIILGPNHRVHIDGGGGPDTITIAFDQMINITLNGEFSQFSLGTINAFVIDAGEGNDTVDITIDLRAIIAAGGGNDSITTSAARDFVDAGDGDDTVDAGGGNDIVFGGDGSDLLLGNAGDDKLIGEAGGDSLSGNDGKDRLIGDWVVPPPEFSFEVHDGKDSLSGNAGNDTLHGGPRADRLAGNGGRDKLYGNGGNDRLYGGANGDWLYGQGGNNQFFGEGGNDRLYADYPGSGGVDTLHGNAGDDHFFSRDSLLDHLFGDGGNDSCIADEDDVLAGIESIT